MLLLLFPIIGFDMVVTMGLAILSGPPKLALFGESLAWLGYKSPRESSFKSALRYESTGEDSTSSPTIIDETATRFLRRDENKCRRVLEIQSNRDGAYYLIPISTSSRSSID